MLHSHPFCQSPLPAFFPIRPGHAATISRPRFSSLPIFTPISSSFRPLFTPISPPFHPLIIPSPPP
ncbi:MAG: hypothetical protein IJK84_05510, partial [Bacteroidales bacterium]|nr:hypothetical protein [Bacteroidales bacterium]